MTIEEAIKNLRRQLALRIGNISLAEAIRSGDKRAIAIQLGIEALELYYELRGCTAIDVEDIPSRLPSEGEE